MAAGGRLEDGSLDILQSTDDDPLLDTQPLPHHSLHAHFRPRFHPLPTVIIANLLLLIHVVFVTLAFLTGVLCLYPDPNEDKCPENYTNPLKVQTAIILGKVILWILHLLFERYIQYHHRKVRSRGYSQIYRSTRHLKALALTIHSSGNTALLLLLCVQYSFPEPNKLYLELILAVLALELICSLSCLVLYTVKIRRFNKAKPQPDVLEEEKSYAYPSNIASETGFRTVSSLEEIVEKQGDIIVYLKRHNALLTLRRQRQEDLSKFKTPGYPDSLSKTNKSESSTSVPQDVCWMSCQKHTFQFRGGPDQPPHTPLHLNLHMKEHTTQ